MIPKKWKIKGIKRNTSFPEAGKLIIDHKLREIFKMIGKYLDNDSDDVLHDLRISVRKLRYVMEVLSVVNDKKSFYQIYEMLKFLQDLIGEGRDLDVLRSKVELIGKDIKVEIPEFFFKKIDDDRIIMREKIREELIKFKTSKTVCKLLI